MEQIENAKVSMVGRMKRALKLTAVAAVMAGGLAVATESGVASAANGGTVMCVNQAPVVGVWVQVSGGVSGWATRSGSGYSQNWSYNTQGKSYILTVGCGGSPARWATSSSTPYYSKNWGSITCFPGWSYGYGTAWVKDRCYNG